MTSSYSFQFTEIDSISVGDRQREEVGSIANLADSIQRRGLLHPIVIDRDLQLIAGERRLEAAKLLGWKEIPTHYHDELDENEKKIIELEENIRRKNLHWKEEVLSILDYHDAQRKVDPEWSLDQTAEVIQLDKKWITQIIQVGKRLRSGDERIHAAEGLHSAQRTLHREHNRRVEGDLSKFHETMQQELEPQVEDSPSDSSEPKPQTSKVRATDQDILCEDFLEWAPEYTGPQFNLLHCDFPYGINHHRSAQGGSKRWGAYQDSPDIYWELLECLCQNLDRFAAASCHLMFWFDMGYYTDTVTRLRRAGFSVWAKPLIWHKSDNRGIIADPERGPRHTYETALFASRGDRFTVQAVADSYSAPTSKAESLHVSQKPIPVLRHFFRMLVDDSTLLLDPTCGSGTSLVAAESLGASIVRGLDREQEYVDYARSLLHRERTLGAAERLVHEHEGPEE